MKRKGNHVTSLITSGLGWGEQNSYYLILVRLPAHKNCPNFYFLSNCVSVVRIQLNRVAC